MSEKHDPTLSVLADEGNCTCVYSVEIEGGQSQVKLARCVLTFSDHGAASTPSSWLEVAG